MSRSEMLMNRMICPKDDEEWGKFIGTKAEGDMTGQ